ncbi:MAG TPA: YegS/Rv2252/BmrU family lipid kinase [Clostridiales bacterium]|nr:YegS/Rv2252/BmrU family lipid kinase [Clostridiales bacterium]
MKQLLFIFNPAAGRGRIKGKLYDIIDIFVKHGYKVHIHPTQKRGDATAYIANDQTDYDLLVCAGGDGTLNEVVTGQMLAGKQVPIGYLPSGSMNDVGHSFKISRNIMAAVDNIVGGKPYAMDIGKFNDQYFIYVAAFGAFTNIAYTTSQKNKNAIGHLSYYLEGIKQLSDLKERQVKLEYDGNVLEDKFIVGLVTNSLYIGGFKNPSYERTSLNDGLLEVLLVKMPKNIYDLQLIVTALLSYKINPTYMYYIQAKKLTITSDQMEWTLDGEYGGSHSRVEIENCNKAIHIISSSLK